MYLSCTILILMVSLSKGCENKAWVGDGFCDDLTNNEACNFDGGDCCGPDVNRQYCMLCQCFKPCKIGLDGCVGGEGDNESTQVLSRDGSCFNPSLVGDGYCDDVTNSLDCNYDGGDCCGSFVNNQYCTECQCIGGSGIGILSRNSETTTLSTKDTNCTTISGPDPNALCIFPFEYNGEIFNECTDKEHDQMWCHTSEDWGNCGPDCTTSSGTPSSSTPMSISGSNDESIPKSIEFPIQLGFDKSFYNYFNRNSSRASQYIQEVVELSSELFSQPSSKLPVISWAIDSEILELQNIRFHADQMCSEDSQPSTIGREKMNQILKIRRNETKPLILFTEDLKWDDGAYITACSFNDIACGDENGNSLLVLDLTWLSDHEDQDKQDMARSLAHEFGHMIGMSHDFDHNTSRNCDGIMDYNGKNHWSDCSIDDFKDWWMTIGQACSSIQSQY